MLQTAHRGGTRVLVATPHMFLPPYDNNDVSAIRTNFAETVQRLEELAGQPRYSFLSEISLRLGSENYISPEFLEALEARAVVPLHGSFYLLVEFPPFLSFEMLLSAIERITRAGFVPLFAHVERYPIFQDNPERLTELARKGCLFQVNGASLDESRSLWLCETALSFLRQGLVHVIASDAHDSRVRGPDLKSVVEILRKKRFPMPSVKAWLFDNPKKILSNKNVNEAPESSARDRWRE